MGNSSLIVGALVIGFVFYVTAKGELPTYISIFLGQVTPGPPITGPSSGGSASSIASAVSVAAGLGGTAGGLDTNLGGTFNGGIVDTTNAGTVGNSIANSDIGNAALGVPDFFDC